MVRTLVIATKNAKKLHELQRYLKTVKANVISLASFEKAPTVREDGDTFRKNAVKKAVRISKFVK